MLLEAALTPPTLDDGAELAIGGQMASFSASILYTDRQTILLANYQLPRNIDATF